MLKAVLAAILWLHPSPHARTQAKVIVKEAKRRTIHPAHIVAAIQHETGGTWYQRAKSRTNDYGLMQLHVGKHTHAKYRGRETDLFKLRLNIYLGTRMMWYWRRHHQRKCGSKEHHWINHYNQGHRVYRRSYGRRHMKIFRKLIKKFWKSPPPIT
jgi:hypothetical protein